MEAFNPFEKQHQRVLLLVPHQDDEICILSVLHRHLQNKDAVKVVWAAVDGDSKLAQVRKLESQKAMEDVGISQEDLDFLDVPQLYLYQHIPLLVERFREIINDFHADIVYCPAYEGGHLDHDTVHYCAFQAAGRSETQAQVLEFPLYNGFGKHGIFQRIPRFGSFLAAEERIFEYSLSPQQIRQRKEWWKIYQSQTGLFNLLILLSGSRRMFWAKEQVRPIPDYDYSFPPHTGKLNYEVNFPQTFADFRQAVIAYEQTL